MIIDKKYNKIQVFKGGLVTFYNLDVIGSISPYKNLLGEYGIEVDIIADGRCNRDSFKFLLKDVTNQITWTDDIAGANIAADTIAMWADTSASGLATEATLQEVNAGIPSSLGKKSTANSMSVTLSTNENQGGATPYLLITSAAGSIGVTTRSIGVANTGLANAIVLGQVFKPGLELSLNPGEFNTYAAGSFTYDATGTELTITYNT